MVHVESKTLTKCGWEYSVFPTIILWKIPAFGKYGIGIFWEPHQMKLRESRVSQYNAMEIPAFSKESKLHLVSKSHTGELGYDGPLYDGFLHMTDDILGPSPMHIKYSSYVCDGFCIWRTNFPGPIESVISKFTCIRNENAGALQELRARYCICMYLRVSTEWKQENIQSRKQSGWEEA